MASGEQLGDGAAHRDADQVGVCHAAGGEHTQRVRGQVMPGVGRVAGRAAGGLAGIAVVVADDLSSLAGQPNAELVVPPVHRGREAADQEDGRVSRVTERLDTQLDAVDSHEALDHVSFD